MWAPLGLISAFMSKGDYIASSTKCKIRRISMFIGPLSPTRTLLVGFLRSLLKPVS